MKNMKKLISILLVAMLLITTVVTAGVSASAVSGTLASYYSTNAAGFGKEKTITVDGDISDWDSSMLIAQGTANDDPRVYRPNSMYELAEDLYALYACYDNSNLYLMWEMTNVQDIVSPLDDYPLTQGILYDTSEFPLFIFIDTGKSSDAIGNQGKTTTGGTLWDKHITTDNVFNRVIATDVKGNNGPWVYGGSSSGVNPVEMYNRTTSGITVKYGKGILSSKVNGINKGHGTYNGRVPGDVCNESADWVDFNTLGHKSSTLDFHYEVSIPLEKLGITKSDITTNGIGAMLVITSGMSGMDSLPYDLSMSDKADLDDGEHSHENNSFEKSDDDHIVAPFARIGKQGDTPTPPPTQATTATEATTATQATTPTQGGEPSSTLTVNSTSNYFSGNSVSNLKVGDTVTVKYDLASNFGVASAQWNLSYDASKLRLKTSADSLCSCGGIVNAAGNPIYGNFTDAQNLYSFNGGKAFVSAEFEVIGTGSAQVDLTVEELNIGYKSGNTLNLATPVENGVTKNITSVPGFSNASLAPTSTVTKDGGEIISGDLIVKAKSNYFLSNEQVFETGKRISVAYKLKSNFGLVNTQWKMTYDTSKLQFESAYMPKANDAIYKTNFGSVNCIYSSLKPIGYSTLDDFVVFNFNTIGTGETNVNLDVQFLSVGYVSDDEKTKEAYVVKDSTKQNITGTPGFSSFSSSTGSEVYENSVLRGDVDQNGVVDINDATLIQRYLAEFTTLSSAQMRAADANKDGRVSIKDAITIQRYKAGLIPKLPD